MDSRDFSRWPQKLEVIRRCAVTLIMDYRNASLFVFLTKHLIATSSIISSDKVKIQTPEQRSPTIESRISYEKLDEEMSTALMKARNVALNTASEGLDKWVEEMMGRVDPDFLDWYFGYWIQQKMQLASIYHDTFHLIYKKHPSAEEKIHEEIAEEFPETCVTAKHFSIGIGGHRPTSHEPVCKKP